MKKNSANQGVYLYAYDSNGAKTGDAANITATISKDGAAAAPTATTNPTEIGGGTYWLPLSQVETDCDCLAIVPVSATSGVTVTPAYAYPGVVPAVAGDAMGITANQTVATVTTLTNLPSAPADWLTAAAVKADAVTKIQAGLLTAAGYTAPDNATIALIAGYLDTEIAALITAVGALPNAAAIKTALEAAGSHLAKIKAAVYDSAAVSGTGITLSTGATQTVTATGRVTAE